MEQQRYGVTHEVFTELLHIPYPVSITMMNLVVPTNKKLSPKLRRPCNIYMVNNPRPTTNILLSAIQPTSTDSERSYSEAGNSKTKIRKRMKFRVLNALVFF
jgi:hypothetical protein